MSRGQNRLASKSKSAQSPIKKEFVCVSFRFSPCVAVVFRSQFRKKQRAWVICGRVREGVRGHPPVLARKGSREDPPDGAAATAASTSMVLGVAGLCDSSRGRVSLNQ